MEKVFNEAEEGVPNECKTTTVVKHVREVRVNYRGPKILTAPITSASDAADFVGHILPDNSREHFVALYLDGGHRIISYAVTSTGTANSCPVHPREIFQRAILVGSVAAVLIHNHPSGQCDPSDEDIRVTRLLSLAGDTIGIKILDHVIVGNECHYSFAEAGKLR